MAPICASRYLRRTLFSDGVEAAGVFGDTVRDIRFFRFGHFDFMGHDIVIARSRYSKQGGLLSDGKARFCKTGCGVATGMVRITHWEKGTELTVETQAGRTPAAVQKNFCISINILRRAIRVILEQRKERS